MGLDAEEGLAHDDERRDVEDEIRGQIVEIQEARKIAAGKAFEGVPD